MSMTTLSKSVEALEKRLLQKERRAEKIFNGCGSNASDDQLQALAAIVRNRFHEPNTAIYQIMRIINYTNICITNGFLSHFRLPKFS